jgi:hypothetical protein
MDDPGQMMHEPIMTMELNEWNFIQSLHGQMCRQPSQYRRYIADLLPYLIPYLITLLSI